MKRPGAIILLLLLTVTLSIISLSASAYGGNESDIYLKGESFVWKEFDDDGSQLLKETGPVFGVGGSSKWDIKSLLLKVRGEFFGGTVYYDGQTTGTNNPISVETDTDYLGVKFEGNFGWRFMITEGSSIEPFFGPAVRYWSRRIRSTNIGNVRVVEGKEKWLSVYAPLGVRAGHVLNKQMALFAEGGIKLPIYNENRADLTELHDVKVKLKPGREYSGFAEAGFKWKMLRAALFYEGLRFSKSATVSKSVSGGTLIVWQPESTADIFGVNVGLAF